MQEEVANFEKKMKWNKTKSSDIIKFIKKDAKELNSKNSNHKIIDLIFECMQFANRKNINVDKELKRHMKEAEIKHGI